MFSWLVNVPAAISGISGWWGDVRSAVGGFNQDDMTALMQQQQRQQQQNQIMIMGFAGLVIAGILFIRK